MKIISVNIIEHSPWAKFKNFTGPLRGTYIPYIRPRYAAIAEPILVSIPLDIDTLDKEIGIVIESYERDLSKMIQSEKDFIEKIASLEARLAAAESDNKKLIAEVNAARVLMFSANEPNQEYLAAHRASIADLPEEAIAALLKLDQKLVGIHAEALRTKSAQRGIAIKTETITKTKTENAKKTKEKIAKQETAQAAFVQSKRDEMNKALDKEFYTALRGIMKGSRIDEITAINVIKAMVPIPKGWYLPDGTRFGISAEGTKGNKS